MEMYAKYVNTDETLHILHEADKDPISMVWSLKMLLILVYNALPQINEINTYKIKYITKGLQMMFCKHTDLTEKAIRIIDLKKFFSKILFYLWPVEAPPF